MRYVAYLMLAVVLVSFGAYIWKVRHSGLLAADFLPHSVDDDHSELASQPTITTSSVVLEVGGEKIEKDDIDWEYQLLVEGVFDKQSMTAIPDLGNRYHGELLSLKKSILSSLVERKVLFNFIRSDRDFDSTDPARFTDCLKAWQNSIASGHKGFQSKEDRFRLKSRLCEKSILDQYLKERVFSKIVIKENEINEYYRNHLSEFRVPDRVVIHQVVLADEALAQRISHQINPTNFEQIAKANSITPEASVGGKLGPFAKGTMPSFFDVAFHMKKGEISQVLKSPYGFHILMLTEKKPASQASLDVARPSIQKLLIKKREVEEYQKLIEQALAAVHVSTPAPLW